MGFLGTKIILVRLIDRTSIISVLEPVITLTVEITLLSETVLSLQILRVTVLLIGAIII